MDDPINVFIMIVVESINCRRLRIQKEKIMKMREVVGAQHKMDIDKLYG